MSSGIFKVIGKFTDNSGYPLTGDEFEVALLDEDRYFDDKLGTTSLNADGEAEFIINAVDILSIDSAGETTPDLYFVVRKGGKEIFRSKTFSEVDFELKDPVTGRAKGLTKAFGPFQVTISR